MSKIKMIKKDAKINIQIGAGFIEKLNLIALNISKKITEEDIKRYQGLAASLKPNEMFEEDWMNDITTLSMLFANIQEEAEKQGFTYEKDFDEFTNELNKGVDSLLPQSPEQPE
jgi:hypothetical protein